MLHVVNILIKLNFVLLLLLIAVDFAVKLGLMWLGLGFFSHYGTPFIDFLLQRDWLSTIYCPPRG
jgi:hypothetical protein